MQHMSVVPFQESWLRWGLVAATALSLLVLLSFRPLRSLGYQFFLIAHLFGGV